MMSHKSISAETIYTTVWSEMSAVSDRIWRLRSWAITLAAAVYLAVVGANFYGNVTPEHDPRLFSGIALLVGAVANFGLWHLGVERDRSAIRLACYLWWFEHRYQMDRGWVQWAFYQNITIPRPWRKMRDLASEVQVWLAAAYTATLLVWWWLSGWDSLFLVFAGYSLIFLYIGGRRRVAGHNFRKKALKEFLVGVKSAETWHQTVQESVCPEPDD